MRNLIQFELIKNLPFQGILKNMLNPAIRRGFFHYMHFCHKPADTFLDLLNKAIVTNRKIYGLYVLKSRNGSPYVCLWNEPD